MVSESRTHTQIAMRSSVRHSAINRKVRICALSPNEKCAIGSATIFDPTDSAPHSAFRGTVAEHYLRRAGELGRKIASRRCGCEKRCGSKYSKGRGFYLTWLPIHQIKSAASKRLNGAACIHRNHMDMVLHVVKEVVS